MELPKRRHSRLTHYNYALAGCYFVTICTHNRREILGRIVEGRFNPSAAGKMVQDRWEAIPSHHPLTHLDEYVVMPNHVHGIIVLDWRVAGDAGVAPTTLRGAEVHPDRAKPGPSSESLSAIIGSFKAGVSRKLRWNQHHDHPLWQRGFHEHVIRSDEALHTIREYVVNNPLGWQLDELNAHRTDRQSFYDWLGSV